jgi:hypothetical protein
MINPLGRQLRGSICISRFYREDQSAAGANINNSKLILS